MPQNDDEAKKFVDTYITPGIKALIELLSKSNIQEDVELAEELKQLI